MGCTGGRTVCFTTAGAGRSAFMAWITGRAAAGDTFGALETAVEKFLYSSAVMVRKKSCFF